MKTFYIIVWIFYFFISESYGYINIKDKIEEWLRSSNENKQRSNDTGIKTFAMRHFEQQTETTKNKDAENDIPFEHQNTKKINSARIDSHVATEHLPLARRFNDHVAYRRQYKYYDVETRETDRESSTSLEMQQWREKFELDWVNKKMSAIKEKLNTSGALTINMVGGRPWAVPCGDPVQHDLPWGTCTLPYECESEFRIYRGDAVCGRSKFVCCAVQLTQHDLYQAMDMSFIDTSLSTSSGEKKKKRRGSKELKHKKKLREINRRRRRRFRLKRHIKKIIRKLARQIRKSLNRAFRNSTGDIRAKTKILKNQIKKMKKKFYFDRKVAKNIHDFDVQKVDHDLKVKLSYIRDLNHNFLMNDTFRLMIFNNNKTALRTLIDAELQKYISNVTQKVPAQAEIANSEKLTRRSGDRVVHKKKKRKVKDYLEYDIEYGALYY